MQEVEASILEQLNPFEVMIDLINTVRLGAGQYVDVFSFLYTAQALALVIICAVFFHFTKKKTFDRNRLLTTHWLLLAVYHLGAFLALQGHFNGSFIINPDHSSVISQFSHYLSMSFIAMGIVETFIGFRFRNSHVLWAIFASVVLALGIQVGCVGMDSGDRFWYKTVPPAILTGIVYLSLGMYFCPCLNKRFSKNRRYFSSYSLNLPLMLYGASQFAFAYFYSNHQGASTLNIGVVLMVFQMGLQYQIGIGLLKIGLLIEETRSKELNELVLKSEKYGLVGQLSAGIVHDLNNVLTLVLGSAELAKKCGSDKEKLDTHLGRIENGAQSGSILTKQLLEMAKARQQDRSDRAPFSPDELIHRLSLIFETALPENIELELDLKIGPRKINVSVGEFEMVLLNLIINARDSLMNLSVKDLRKRKIIIRTRLDRNLQSQKSQWIGVERNYVKIMVIDNGPGMNDETQRKAEEFGFTTKLANGTGLGLFNSARFAEENDGRHLITSSPDLETRVEIQLPAETKNKKLRVITIGLDPETAMNYSHSDWSVLPIRAMGFKQLILSKAGGVLILGPGETLDSDQLHQKLMSSGSPQAWKVLKILSEEESTHRSIMNDIAGVKGEDSP